jgi:hypothetical protein
LPQRRDAVLVLFLDNQSALLVELSSCPVQSILGIARLAFQDAGRIPIPGQSLLEADAVTDLGPHQLRRLLVSDAAKAYADHVLQTVTRS